MPLPLGGLNILDASKSAAQRRKNVATAAGRGLWCCGGMSPFRGERVTSRDTFRRTPFRTSSTTRSTPPEMFSFDDVQLDSGWISKAQPHWIRSHGTPRIPTATRSYDARHDMDESSAMNLP